jgi:hypothetical protein
MKSIRPRSSTPSDPSGIVLGKWIWCVTGLGFGPDLLVQDDPSAGCRDVSSAAHDKPNRFP